MDFEVKLTRKRTVIETTSVVVSGDSHEAAVRKAQSMYRFYPKWDELSMDHEWLDCPAEEMADEPEGTSP